MWTTAVIAILVVEALLLLGFVLEKIKKRKVNETVIFLGAVFVVCLVLHLLSFVYDILESQSTGSHIIAFLECISGSLGMFVGDVKPEKLGSILSEIPLFPYAYFVGVVLALLATISTAIETFYHTIQNAFRLRSALRKTACDLVLGNSPQALLYAKSCNALLLLDDSLGKEGVNELVEEGYGVLNRLFTVQLLASSRFNKKTRYNIICLDEAAASSCLDTFISFKKANPGRNNFYLYLQLEAFKDATIHRAIIQENGCEAWIDTFCTDEMTARSFVEENPLTKYLPADCFEMGALKGDTKIECFVLGFGEFSKEVYRQLVLNNQFVAYTGETYKLLPVSYHICDKGVNSDAWEIDGLGEALLELDRENHFPLPEIPFRTDILDQSPESRKVIKAIKTAVEKEKNHVFVLVDAGEDCRSIALADALKTALMGKENFRLFVHAEAEYVKDDAHTHYFGKRNSIFNHDVIVNDSLALMAKKINEVYTERYAGEEEKKDPNFDVAKKAAEDWEKLDHFTLYSNLYSAMSLRLKLNLLGLDYLADGKSENLNLLAENSPFVTPYDYDCHNKQTVRNALIAQEHARWNAYHLLCGHLPMEREEIIRKPAKEGEKVRFAVKNPPAKKHACLTTYDGLDQLSDYLAKRAENGSSAKDYDYYIYDELLISSADEILEKLHFSLKEKSPTA